MEMSNIDEMIATLKPEVLAKFDLAFWMNANELNSRAAVLGKLLSEQGSFFRELVKALPKGSEQTTQTGVVITQWKRAYSEESVGELSRLRDELQAGYNDLQKQLNGCRKQIKDAVRAYNLDAERQYQAAYGPYQVAAKAHNLDMERIRSAAETLRQQALQELATLRVRTTLFFFYESKREGGQLVVTAEFQTYFVKRKPCWLSQAWACSSCLFFCSMMRFLPRQTIFRFSWIRSGRSLIRSRPICFLAFS